MVVPSRPHLSSDNRQVNVPADELFQVICDAASQDPSKMRASTDRLKELLDMTGSFDALSEIAVQQSLPLQVRQLSIIQLKNAVGNHWRSRKLVPLEQRERIRQRCLLLVNEPDDVVAECNQVITAKISRQDFPVTWPAVIPHLVNIIDVNLAARYTGGNSEFLPLRRSLELLHAITKEFSTIKMAGGMRSMAQIVEATHLKLQDYYSAINASLAGLSPSSVADSRVAEDLLLAHLSFKCLTKCATWSYQKIKGDERIGIDSWLQGLFKSTVGQLQVLTEKRVEIVVALQPSSNWSPVVNSSINYLTRHIFAFGKFYRRLLQLDASRFVTFPTSDELVYYYWNKVIQATGGPSGCIANSNGAIFPIRFLVQGMVVFKDSLASWSPTRKDGTVNQHGLSKTFVEDAVKMLVTRFIPLNPSDLEEWMSDPEEWVNVEERDNEQWEYEIRPCGERVLMTLSVQCREFVEPLLRSTWDEVRGLQATDLTTVLQKEAVYCALGRCAHRMKDVISFSEWLQTNLAVEARGTSSTYPILKRRIAWLIGKWVSSSGTTANNPMIWEVLSYLLQDRGPGTDSVVRLTAAVAIRECIDTLDFDVEVFAPYISPIVTHLVSIISEADTLESKRRVSNCLNTLIECAGLKIIPLMQVIAEPIPQLWMAAGEDWLFKAVLLETVSKLVGATMEHSVSLTGLVVPLLRESFSETAISQLDEDGLALWLIALQNTTTLDSVNGAPGLGELFPLAIHLLGNNLDLLGKIVSIVESYTLLDAPRLLQAYGDELFKAFETGMSQALAVNVKGMLSALSLLLQLAGPYQVWGKAMHTSGLFAHVVKTLSEEKFMSTVLMQYVHVLARVAVANNALFLELMSLAGQTLNMPPTQAWEDVLNQWWSRFDNMYEPRHRKLTAMGIASLVATGHPDVLERLPTEICNMWTDVFGELREAVQRASDEGSGTLTLYWDRPAEDLFADCKGTVEFNRRKLAYENDIVRTTQLTAFIGAAMQEAEVACGGRAVFAERYLAKIDPTIMEQIRKEVTGL
ncbi:hypothetical protein EIP91_004237 [Steccherinum ochraceum]|uniref:Importin N-terminal domain-containing protein n=1 Tax=Steccherinum ochraceum TaxID=92696 RepID=A0A4V2MVZ2_9APHY|nr:hypothetical protein EIP91_004237 [Steccherinum ochraceum]